MFVKKQLHFIHTFWDTTVAFRRKMYHSIEDLQNDLDEWIAAYNEERTHSGKYCFGKTPMQTFKDSLCLAKEKMLETKFSNHQKTTQLSD